MQDWNKKNIRGKGNMEKTLPEILSSILCQLERIDIKNNPNKATMSLYITIEYIKYVLNENK